MRSALLGVTLLAAAMLSGSPAARASVCTDGGVVSYPPPPATDGPFMVSAGPGGTWYSEGNLIVRIEADASIDQFQLPDQDVADAGWLAWTGGNKVWFSDRGTGRLGTIDGHGHVVEFQIPSGVNGTSRPQGLVLGPGPHVWFADEANDRIGDFDTSTGAMTFYPVPSGGPLGLTRGTDGALYFTERPFDKIGRLAADGTFREWSLAPGAFPNSIMLGPDGAIWFTELFAGQIGRIAADGTLTETPIAGGPVGLTVGPDGNMYVALWLSKQLGRLDLNGQLTRTWSVPGSLLVGSSRGELWLTDPFRNAVASVHVNCGT